MRQRDYIMFLKLVAITHIDDSKEQSKWPSSTVQCTRQIHQKRKETISRTTNKMTGDSGMMGHHRIPFSTL